MALSGVFIVAAKRTAFGAFGGKLAKVSPTELAVSASQAALASCGLDPARVSSCVMGNVIQSSGDAIYLARHVALKSGMAISTPALTVNRLCGSGFQSLVTAASDIRAGEAEIVLAGGTENMSMSPFVMRDGRFGTPFGSDLKLACSLTEGLTDAFCKTPMAITAENLAVKYGLTRRQCDEHGALSQARYFAALEAGVFKAEIAPVTVKGKKGAEEAFATDEHPRRSTADDLARLGPVFKKDGTVTAGNASGICDGAAALVVAGEAALAKNNLKPLARIVSWGVCGVEPSLMGIGPVPAIQMALARANLKLSQMDLIEVNEAFAAQFLAVAKELSLPMERTNVNGGAISVGHPLAASGSRIVTHLTHELRRKNLKYAVGSACIGGGQGIAVVLERCD